MKVEARIKRRPADPLQTGHIRRIRSRLLLAKDRDDVLFRKPARLHRPFSLLDGLYSNPEESYGRRSAPVGPRTACAQAAKAAYFDCGSNWLG